MVGRLNLFIALTSTDFVSNLMVKLNAKQTPVVKIKIVP